MVGKIGQSYFDYAVTFNRWSMRFLGLWPSEDNFFSEVSFSLAIAFVIQAALPVSYFISTITDFLKDLDAILLFLVIIGSIVKLLFMKIHKKNLKIVLEEMLADWKSLLNMCPNNQEILISNATYGRKLSLYFMTSIFIAAVVFMTSPLYLPGQEISVNTNYKLPFKAQYPGDVETALTYKLLSQIVSSIYMLTTIIAIDSFLIVTVLHLCSQLEIIGNKMKFLNHTNVYSHLQMMGFRNCKCFKCIIEHYIQIQRNLKIIQKPFNVIMLIQIGSDAIVLCVEIYTIVKSTSSGNIYNLMSYIIFILYSAFNVFIYCYLGDRVITKSTSITDKVYETTWYDMDPKFRRLLIIVIARSSKPFELKAGYFFTMSLVLYKSIIFTAFSYASCLLAISKK